VPESWAYGNRVIIEDSRDDGTYLRVTWHPDGQKFVVSHWRDDVCLAATRVDPTAIPGLIALLARGLGDVAAGVAPQSGEGPAPLERGWLDRVRGWLTGRIRYSARARNEVDGPQELRRGA